MRKKEPKNVRIAKKENEIKKKKLELREKKQELREIKKEGSIYGDPIAEVQW